MRIGIRPTGNRNAGGIYQYGVTMLDALYDHKLSGGSDDFIVFTIASPLDLMHLDRRNWDGAMAESNSLKDRIIDLVRQKLGEGAARKSCRWVRRRIRAICGRRGNAVPETEAQYFRQQLEAANVNLLIYPFPAAVASEARVPYVMAIHDLQHRLQPEFPEVSANGEWERREHIFRNGAQGATLLLADSEVGKEDILNCYGKQGVRPDQIKVLPFLPYVKPETSSAERYRVRVRYDLPERYLFYPAQFWPHKNHRRIIQALRVLKDEQEMDVPVVFCGSHTGAIRKRTFKEMMATASQLGLRNNVRYLGYVSDDDISAIYAESSGLVMPTFFGPTNIPVLEAWAAGCPVLTSDIRGIREQVGDAGLLADPRSVESIADGIRRLWTDSELGRTLAQRGRRRLAAYTPANYREALIEAIEEAKLRLRDGSAKWRLKSA